MHNELTTAEWFKSSRSNGQNSCVEVAFLSDGRVKILFQGRKFYQYTKGAYAQSHPTICYPKWTKA